MDTGDERLPSMGSQRVRHNKRHSFTHTLCLSQEVNPLLRPVDVLETLQLAGLDFCGQFFRFKYKFLDFKTLKFLVFLCLFGHAVPCGMRDHTSVARNQICAPLHWEHGEGNGTPLQYCCLENPMDRGVWWAEVHGVAKS